MSGARESAATRIADRTALALVVLAALLCALHQLVAYDLWWQLASGAWIVEHGLPTRDPFSFGYPERPWIELRWLGFVLGWALSQAAGLNALIVAKIAILGLTFAALWVAMGDGPRWTRTLGLLAALVLMLSRFKVRPELFSFLFLALFLAVYERHRRGASARWLGLLPLFQVLWSNTHTLWILGPAIAWTAWACEMLPARFAPLRRVFDDFEPLPAPGRRALLATAAAVSAAGLVTPYLFLGYVFPLTFFEQMGVGSDLRSVISELRSPFELASDLVFFVPYVVVAVASGASFALPGAPFSPFRLSAWAGALGFSFLSARNVSLFGLVGGWLLAVQLESWWRVRRDHGPLEALLPTCARFAVVLVASALIVAAATDWLWRSRGWEQRFGSGVAQVLFPIQAMAFVREQGLPRPVLTSLADASYLILEGGPKSVYVDGRLEVYGAAAILESTRDYSEPERLLEIADRHGIDTVLLAFPLMRRAVDAFEDHPDWVPVYYDAGRVAYLRRGPGTREAVAKLGIDWRSPVRRRARIPPHLDPPDWIGVLTETRGLALRLPDARAEMGRGQLLLHVGAFDAASDEFRAALEIDPDLAEAHGLIGIIAWARGRFDAAAPHLARAPSGWLERIDVLETRAELAERAGDVAQAFDFSAIAIGAGSVASHTRRRLVETAIELGLEDRAAIVLQRAADGAADDTAALLLGDLGALAQARDMCRDALRHFAAALDRDPERASLWRASAACHQQLGDAQAARAALERARSLDAVRRPDA